MHPDTGEDYESTPHHYPSAHTITNPVRGDTHMSIDPLDSSKIDALQFDHNTNLLTKSVGANEARAKELAYSALDLGDHCTSKQIEQVWGSRAGLAERLAAVMFLCIRQGGMREYNKAVENMDRCNRKLASALARVFKELGLPEYQVVEAMEKVMREYNPQTEEEEDE